jgi:hypothetical protein
MLAALGYVGGATAAPEGEDLADPKDKIHLYESVGYAAHLMTGEDYEEAAGATPRSRRPSSFSRPLIGTQAAWKRQWWCWTTFSGTTRTIRRR